MNSSLRRIERYDIIASLVELGGSCGKEIYGAADGSSRASPDGERRPEASPSTLASRLGRRRDGGGEGGSQKRAYWCQPRVPERARDIGAEYRRKRQVHAATIIYRDCTRCLRLRFSGQFHGIGRAHCRFAST